MAQSRCGAGWVAALVMGTAGGEAIGQEFVALAPLNVARQYAACAELNGRVYVIGGLAADGTALASVERYDAVNDRWTFVAPLPQARDHAVAVATNQWGGATLCVIGGFAGNAVGQRELYRYNDSNNTWSVASLLPEGRGAAAAVDISSGILIVGGSASDHVPTNTAHTFRPGAPIAWVTEALMPTAREGAAGVYDYGEYSFVIGGRSEAGLTGVNEKFGGPNRWWQAAPAMPTARAGMAGVRFHERFWVFGGEAEDGVSARVESYVMHGVSWESWPDMAMPRHGVAAAEATVRGACGIILAGGATGAGLTPTTYVDFFIAPSPADWNRDRVVNSQDYFDFTNDYFAGHGDFNGSGTVNSQDFFDYLAAFFQYCY